MALPTIGLIAAIVVILLYNTIKVLKEYERGVVFFLGRFQRVKGPGLILLFPVIQVMTKVDLRVIVLDVYRSRETDTLGVDAAQIAGAMQHAYARHIGARRHAAQFILDRIRPGDVLLTLGAGDGNDVGKWVLEGIRERTRVDPKEGFHGRRQ